MNKSEDSHPKKKVTAATIDAPQEEFVSQEGVPSEPEIQTERKDDDPPVARPRD